ncbi:MAG: transglutaminase domain-containing protein [Actinobacteria bacterium]|nr:MAG: transglutaminase domain-containing protein [Actinomycetota bacterium]
MIPGADPRHSATADRADAIRRAVAAPPRDRYRAPIAQAMRAQALRIAEAGPPAPDLTGPAIRLVCVLAAGAFALHRWLGLIDAPPRGALFRTVLVTGALGAVLLRARRIRSRARRVGAIAGAIAGALVVLLLVAGTPFADLAPRAWGRLADGIGGGIAAMPAINVPYEGHDPWARVVLALSGLALLALAVVAATWPRRRGAGSRPLAVAVLAVLYGVPSVQLNALHPWRVGAVFAIALLAVLHAERLRPRQAPLAAAAVLVTVAGGLVFAPRLDGAGPIVDVQDLASRLEGRGQVSFSWNHRYGPLDWPRDGREVLRVRARRAAYWKAETLEDFDGRRWVAGPPGDTTTYPRPDWTQHIRVTLRALRSRQFIGAGTTTYVSQAPKTPVDGTAGGYVTRGSPLESGDTYDADVYYPTPTPAELRDAGFAYPGLSRDLQLVVPVGGGRRIDVFFEPWGSAGPPQVRVPGGFLGPGGERALARSPYARVDALARRLRAGARTPIEYVRAVQRHLQQGFAYDESPPQRSAPLAAFLLRDRRGYCQQFSGAMAMLLRMGGVPARVATGFTPGIVDQAHGGDYVVRDIDAHSWVEAFFPGIGWVTFDPTPSIAPARSQLQGAGTGVPNPAGDRPAPTGRDAPEPGGGRGDGGAGPATPWWRSPLLLAPALLLLLGIPALVAALRAERRRHPPTAPELAELERALRRTGRDARPPTTLRDLERLLGPDPRAAGYLRAVSAGRYGGNGHAPTAQERRALRRALGDGLGVRGRMRALWALPPRALWRRAARR